MHEIYIRIKICLFLKIHKSYTKNCLIVKKNYIILELEKLRLTEIIYVCIQFIAKYKQNIHNYPLAILAIFIFDY